MNLCVDIDGTITDPYYWLELANQYFRKRLINQDITHYDISKLLGISQEAYEDFYEKHKFLIHSTQKMRTDVKPVINRLARDNKVFFVTARDKSLTILTHVFLRRHEIPYDGLYLLGSPDKVKKAGDLACDLFIEDSLANAKALAEAGYPVILINTNYNQEETIQGVTRVDTWDEIENFIRTTKKESLIG